jgi:scyllo-inositol 2-dehydrogenase (NADP+)
MPSPIRVAVLGFGLAGRVFHCPFVAAVPGLELTAIVQRRGDEASLAYPGARVLRSAEEALADPGIDLIVVGTPNATHARLARQALEAGKHVVVDKPLATTVDEITSLIQLAAERNLVLAPFHNRRWDGDFLTLRKVLDAGSLGRLVRLRSRFDRFRPTPRPNTWKEEAGDTQGLLQDLGPHLIDQALALFGAPDRLTGSVRKDRDVTEIVDGWDIRLEYERNGKSLVVEVGSSMLAADPAPRFSAHGTLGSFTKYGVDPQEPAMVREGVKPPRLGSPEPWLDEPVDAWGLLVSVPPSDPDANPQLERIPTEPGDYRGFYANVRDAIRGEASLAVPPLAALHVAQITALAQRSSLERRTLPVELTRTI